MGEEDDKKYLGDIIGKYKTEEKTFGGILEKMTKLGEKWNKERMRIHGRTIVANTLLIAKLSHRASVNRISNHTKKIVKRNIRTFIWRGPKKRSRVKWDILTMDKSKGGAGIRDPVSALDANKIKILQKISIRKIKEKENRR